MRDIETVYRTYFNDVYRYLLRLTHGDTHLSEDLSQETFFRAIKSIDSFEEKSSLYSWLCQIAKHAYYNYLRKNKHLVSGEVLETLAANDNVSETVKNAEEAAKIRGAIELMTEPYKSILSLRIDEELSFLEIGSRYGKTETWARVTFHRAKNKVKEQLL